MPVVDAGEFKRLLLSLDAASIEEANLRALLVKNVDGQSYLVTWPALWDKWKEAAEKRRKAEAELLAFERRDGLRSV